MHLNYHDLPAAAAAAVDLALRVFMPFLASEAVEAATVEDAVDEAKLTILDPELFEEAGFACPAPEFPEFRLDFSSSVITVEFATFFN